ncbi:hypothetical protein EBU58_13070 [bacterium]|nr:hypothetical protein [bacterium]
MERLSVMGLVEPLRRLPEGDLKELLLTKDILRRHVGRAARRNHRQHTGGEFSVARTRKFCRKFTLRVRGLKPAERASKQTAGRRQQDCWRTTKPPTDTGHQLL